MKLIVLFTVLIIFCHLEAEEKKYEYKNWKTFRSDYGYEFKYPECWVVKGDGPDEPDIALPDTKSITVNETEACKRPRMHHEIPNHVGFSAGWNYLNSRDEVEKILNRDVKGFDIAVIRDDWKIHKRLKFEGGGEGFIYVTNHNNVSYKWIRWEMNLYCGIQEIQIASPSIKNPDEALLKKFKAGDLGLPEPEKTIYESIKCIEPKIKPPAKKLKK